MCRTCAEASGVQDDILNTVKWVQESECYLCRKRFQKEFLPSL